jgi:hypothetical protein
MELSQVLITVAAQVALEQLGLTELLMPRVVMVTETGQVVQVTIAVDYLVMVAMVLVQVVAVIQVNKAS